MSIPIVFFLSFCFIVWLFTSWYYDAKVQDLALAQIQRFNSCVEKVLSDAEKGNEAAEAALNKMEQLYHLTNARAFAITLKSCSGKKREVYLTFQELDQKIQQIKEGEFAYTG
jgi:hypothetical protein